MDCGFDGQELDGREDVINKGDDRVGSQATQGDGDRPPRSVGSARPLRQSRAGWVR
jgi:hypothetical protein